MGRLLSELERPGATKGKRQAGGAMKKKVMRPENKRMQSWLKAHGVTATPKYIREGSMRGCWRLYDKEQPWTHALREKLTSLGLVGFDGQRIAQFAGNAGMLSVFVRGHNEMLDEGG